MGVDRTHQWESSEGFRLGKNKIIFVFWQELRVETTLRKETYQESIVIIKTERMDWVGKEVVGVKRLVETYLEDVAGLFN